ncbi:cation diffusion facilitator CzcD-associated flavoprotein CzcO [Rhodococcus sp. SMB37]|uniref:flavin-containing monooxygenase n=1 Tax=Rhodococcus sp. SMB37 TaxID=2512213 RepID=UPI001049091E|nr:NAD(P)/FAD-dependent oxidoreductase [Rhodococcus sp. SMB37]TCN53379.1 cation diffusion facilitator CzcD-associated flavoprotein CzcO [Rhodococcus sp. SMB37]
MTKSRSEHLDVLIVGAGLSGIGAAVHLKKESPNQKLAIIEGRDNLGGTWDLFRYPGIRSDSDMYTLGYGFKPWTKERAIANGESILDYLWETVSENELKQHIRFGHHVRRAEWSSEAQVWTVTVVHLGETFDITCKFLFMCSGYYNYRRGFTPEFPGRERFTGTVVHPQFWPEDLEYAGKKIIVIGSGATAITLIPNLATKAEKVTMVQRSPSYLAIDQAIDQRALRIRRLFGDRIGYALIRFRNTKRQQRTYEFAQSRPDQFKETLFKDIRELVGQDYLDKHFTPTYQPWDQRVCLIPDGDFFQAIKFGRADVETGKIRTFTESGIELESGERIDADIIVTATGLELVSLGEVDFVVDGELIDFSKRWTYKGLAFSGIPNLAFTFGYVNTSWTVRAELVAKFVSRLLNHMDKAGASSVTPTLRPGDSFMPRESFVEGFTSGYFQRANGVLPRQGNRAPWINPQNHAATKKLLTARIDDGVLKFAHC